MNWDETIEQHGTTLLLLFFIFLWITMGCMVKNSYLINMSFLFILLIIPRILILAREHLLSHDNWQVWMFGAITISILAALLLSWQRYSFFIIIFLAVGLVMSISGALLTFQVEFLSASNTITGKWYGNVLITILAILSSTSITFWEQNEMMLIFLCCLVISGYNLCLFYLLRKVKVEA